MLLCPVRTWIVLSATPLLYSWIDSVTSRVWLFCLSIPLLHTCLLQTNPVCSIQLGYLWTKAFLDQQECFLKEWNKCTFPLASFPGPRPASRHLQYSKAGEGLVHFLLAPSDNWRITNQANIRDKHGQHLNRSTVWQLCFLHVYRQHPLEKPSTHLQCISSGSFFWGKIFFPFKKNTLLTRTCEVISPRTPFSHIMASSSFVISGMCLTSNGQQLLRCIIRCNRQRSKWTDAGGYLLPSFTLWS